MRLRKNVSDFTLHELSIQYGPSGSRFSGLIDLFEEITSRLSLGEYSINQLSIEEVHHAPVDPYAQSDRHIAPAGYLVAGSLGCRIIRPDGEKASLYLVDFHHTRDNHHNLWLWGWDFDGTEIWDKNVPYHDEIPLDQNVYVKVTFGSDFFDDTFKPPKKKK